jgi:mycothiol synthase
MGECIHWEAEMQPIKHWSELPDGYSVQPGRMEDIYRIADLDNLCSIEAIGTIDTTAEEIKAVWQTPNFNLETSSRLVFNQASELVGYVEVWDTVRPPIHPLIWGRVRPNHRRLGIGSALISWSIDRARQVIPYVPEKARVSARFITPSQHEPTKHLFERLGLQIIRHNWQMVVDLDGSIPQPVWPENISIRVFDREHDLPRLYLAEEEAFQDHWGNIQVPFDDGYQRWLHQMFSDKEADPQLWFLAKDGEEIIGAAICRRRSRENEDEGWVRTLFVRRAWRRQGIALALLHHAFGEYKRRGKKRVALGVDAQNRTGATQVYEKAGMRVRRQYDQYELELRPGIELSVE